MTETPKITFAELNLDARIQSAIDAAGYEHPTPIQEQAIPVIKKGGDVTGIAQTGTGKTAAFTLPMMHRLAKGRARARMPRSLILCPTRELAAQVAENFETYGKDLKLNMALLIGGVSFKDQEQKLTRGVDVLIATPGRLIDQYREQRFAGWWWQRFQPDRIQQHEQHRHDSDRRQTHHDGPQGAAASSRSANDVPSPQHNGQNCHGDPDDRWQQWFKCECHEWVCPRQVLKILSTKSSAMMQAMQPTSSQTHVVS